MAVFETVAVAIGIERVGIDNPCWSNKSDASPHLDIIVQTVQIGVGHAMMRPVVALLRVTQTVPVRVPGTAVG